MFRVHACIAALSAFVFVLSENCSKILAQNSGKQPGAMVLYFQSQDCEPCRQLEPSLVRYHQQGWDIRMVDAPNQLDVARQYKIRNLPTLILLSGGREVDRIVGVVSEKQLHERLARLDARTQSVAVSHGGNPPAKSPIPWGNQLALEASENRKSAGNQMPAGNSMVVRGQSPSALDKGFPLLEPTASDAPFQQSDTIGQPSSSADGQLPPMRPVAPGNAVAPANAAAPWNGAASSLEEAIARATDATVRIKVEESNTTAYGTGTIVATHQQEALILTCGHLFRDMLPGSQLKVDLFAGTPRQTTVLAQLIDFKADKEDIGLLSIHLPVAIEPAPILPRNEAVRVGQQVFSLGCDHGHNPSRRDSRVTHVNRYLGPCNIEIEGAPAVGRSGGGLFDAAGRLVGVCNAACSQENEGIYASSDVLYEQLARIGHAHLFDLAGGPSRIQVESTTAVLASNLTGQLPSPEVADQTATVPPQSLPVRLICVLRNPDGSDRVVTIDRAPESLVSTIEQYSSTNR